MNNKRGIRVVGRLLSMQLMVTAVLSALLYGVLGIHAAWSATLGGLVSVLPNAFFARVLFKHHGAQAVQKIARSFYIGEALKLLLTVSLFAVVFKYILVSTGIFFAGFIVAQMVFWFALLVD